MQVLLTFPPSTGNLYTYTGINRQTSTAIYLLGELLKQLEYDVKIMDPLLYFNDEFAFLSNSFIDSMIKDVDVIGISTNSFNWAYAKLLIEKIKKRQANIPIILGGVHPTLMDTRVLSTSLADVVIRKEGEKVLPNLLSSIKKDGLHKLSDIRGITFKDKYGNIVRNIDDIPLTQEEYNNIILPNFEDMPKGYYVGIPCETSRGCLYNCSFCGVLHHNSWKCLDKYNFTRQIDNAIKWAKEKCVSQIIFLGDDCISVDGQRLEHIFTYISERRDTFKVFMEGRLGDLIKLDLDEKFPSEKIIRFLIGIECGYDQGLQLVRKGYKISQIRDAFNKLKGKKIVDSLFGTFIIGLPWENYECCVKTIQFAASLYCDYGVKCNISWWSIIPSYLWDIRKKYNIFVDESIFDYPEWYELDYHKKDSFFLRTHPNLSLNEIEKLVRLIQNYSRSGIKIVDE